MLKRKAGLVGVEGNALHNHSEQKSMSDLTTLDVLDQKKKTFQSDKKKSETGVEHRME